LLVLFWIAGQAFDHDIAPNSTIELLPPTSAPLAESATPANEAALLAVIAQYNMADQQVATTLSLEPIRPFLD
jgi:hypothetical protein